MNTQIKSNTQITKQNIVKHVTKRRVLLRFMAVLLVFILYFVFVSLKYGFGSGVLVSLLTWSLFVLATPVADAGFLLDFPLRLITSIRMVYLEIFGWFLAVSLNIYALIFKPEAYDMTSMLTVFKYILTHPIPYWLIFILAGIGTFISLIFGDELLDKVEHNDRKIHHKHKNKYRYFVMLFVIIATIFVYNILLKKIGISLV